MRGQIPPPHREFGPVQFSQNLADGPAAPVLWPVAPSGDGQGSRHDAFHFGDTQTPTLAPNLGHLPPYSGDGHGRALAAAPVVSPGQSVRSVRTPRGEAMKLAMLVVFFLLWISTASTLLFLYMDRYLFPG